ncbi:hypothetical protein DU475_12570 [Rhodopseudomonas sp. WA056]|uniref:hypothetical protein n=1 Tax=Rhodopseudomonas sp. WA056 TaxID=2269367 RepID=UPI001967D981|nr:hypothetical protein [Rhodopseudomonas sp. WA056]NEW88088.1 hypothetical protein [Rhodopseudomonas sp. WA056]
MGDSLEQFVEWIDHTMKSAWKTHRRFNLACAMQPKAANNMPDLTTICEHICREFNPERIRIVQLDPRQDGRQAEGITEENVNALRQLGIEICSVDARRDASIEPNGFFVADFFDFT